MVSQFLILFIKTTPVNKRPSIFISSYVARIFTHIASLGTKSDFGMAPKETKCPFSEKAPTTSDPKSHRKISKTKYHSSSLYKKTYHYIYLHRADWRHWRKAHTTSNPLSWKLHGKWGDQWWPVTKNTLSFLEVCHPSIIN